ncbi:MAG TPA: S8 family peptidase [Thermoleophilaceae bacterium]
MRRRTVIVLLPVAAALFALTALPSGRQAGGGTAAAGIGNAGPRVDKDKRAAASDEVIVRFEPAADSDKRSRARGAVNAKVKKQLPVSGMQLLALPAGTPPSTAAGRLENQPGVSYAEPNFSRHALGSVNDAYFPYEWGLHNTGQAINGTAGAADADIDAPEAWDVTAGDPSVTVGVIDTGIDATHPDLRAKVDGGWDFVDNDSDPTDLNGHGTHVSGTVAAAGNDGTGVAGVAYNAKMMPLRVLDADGSGSVADVVGAYGYAASHGIRVVNASLGSDSFSRAERDAIAAAPNTLFVVAAGNGGADGVGDDVDQTPEYPCAYPLANIVCVAATDSSDRLAPFSNYGTVGVDIAAPGVDIASDWPTSGYAWSDGTSMATPHVTGTAALVASRFAHASVADLRAALLDGADHPAALAGKVAGGRRLNAYGAVTAPAPAPAPPTTTSPATTPAPGPASSSPAPEAPAPDAPAADTAPAPVPAPAPAAADTTPPIVTVKVASRARSATLRRRGLAVTVSCSESCRISARLVARTSSRTAKIAQTARRLASAGGIRIVVRPSRSALRLWKRIARPGTRLRLALTFRDPAGNAREVVKTVRISR